jgi:hypothetical protein
MYLDRPSIFSMEELDFCLKLSLDVARGGRQGFSAVDLEGLGQLADLFASAGKRLLQCAGRVFV